MKADNYTNNLRQFMTKHHFTELELMVAKNSTMSVLCPLVDDNVDEFTFNSKANKPLITLDDINDPFI
tara:strand:- start:1315 stop:1518 length:204 start_codon:yes stop_codon:yes gene_type:complete